MTTTVSTETTPTTVASPPVTGLRSRADVARLKVTGWRVARSEWSKFASLKSSWITILAAVVVIVGFAVLATAVTSGDVAGPPGGGGGGGQMASDPTSLSLAGASLAQIILGILGILVISGEYSSGMIRATLAAVPRRLPVLWGKAAVIGLVSLVVSVPSVLIAFFLGQAILGDGANVSFSDDGVAQAVLGTGAYLAAVALLGVALGALLRNAAGAIGALFVLLLLAPSLLGLVLPSSWEDSILPYLPSNAGAAFTSVVPTDGLLSTGGGAAVLVAWIVVLLGAAAVLIKRRDA
ncbi:ABC transporter permease subunit [Pengzhenrongella sicca]|uniref:ABC transporter permease subunit n=1 Tax=Pengzhenrongella sicca TaxID=2819238 RepID=A0A8A4ZCJ4_9MICO|nr:ABC transporter permease subunit [Pengzhenrongella sicca]QTE28296.1 ABC transporter permease subunit [Pengzhenrongella sicca]